MLIIKIDIEQTRHKQAIKQVNRSTSTKHRDIWYTQTYLQASPNQTYWNQNLQKDCEHSKDAIFQFGWLFLVKLIRSIAFLERRYLALNTLHLET